MFADESIVHCQFSPDPTKYDLSSSFEEACAKVKGEAHAFYGEAVCLFD
ncbi:MULTISPECIES: hypothetical protein [unclassified Okeania]|nr:MULTISPECIES: hypothetical protein [unclassified Okeania]NES77625.1 hypothetical protein [Okeania sp. SIO1H4]NET13687.1 hypothetical protein [Okeania sp. SIO1H6]NET21253.1 hypothetical protein [Okeania sp. SIO1H5]NET92670.1 hypothetical protein [Okeania sp. SIO1H2]